MCQAEIGLISIIALYEAFSEEWKMSREQKAVYYKIDV